MSIYTVLQGPRKAVRFFFSAVTLTATYVCSTSRQKRNAEDDNDNQPPILTHAMAAGAIMLSKWCDISIAQQEVKSRFAWLENMLTYFLLSTTSQHH